MQNSDRDDTFIVQSWDLDLFYEYTYFQFKTLF